MALLGYCINCNDMMILSRSGKCNYCGGDIVSHSELIDSLWNEKSETEKKAYTDSCIRIKQGDRKEIPLSYDWVGPFDGQYLVYSIEGVRGRHIDVFEDKVIIKTKPTLGSIITKNATDGEKTIYFVDCIGIQFKQSGLTIGYLQIETAASSGNNHQNNFLMKTPLHLIPALYQIRKWKK